MYVYNYVYVHVCVYMCICVYICIYIYIYIYRANPPETKGRPISTWDSSSSGVLPR